MEEEDILDDFLLDSDEIENTDVFNVDSKIRIEGYKDYEVMDIIGGSLYLHMMLDLYGIINRLEGDKDNEITLKVIDTLHRGYFARVYDVSVYDMPVLLREKECIILYYIIL